MSNSKRGNKGDTSKTQESSRCGEKEVSQLEGTSQVEVFSQLFLKMEEQRRRDEEQRRRDDLAREERMTQMMFQLTQTLTEQAGEGHRLQEEKSELDRKAEDDKQVALAHEREKHIALEEERIKLERERLIFEQERRRQEQEDQRRRDKIRATAPMAKMSEKEDVETYLELFEKHEQFLEIPKELWTAHLRPLLNSRAKDVLIGAQAVDEADFDALRLHLVKALGCRTESLGSQCTKLRGNDVETFSELEHRTRKLYSRWLKDMDGQQCLQAVMLEKLYSLLPLQCMHHCRDKKPKTSLELAGIVNDYLADHNMTWQEARRGMRRRKNYQSPRPDTEGRPPLSSNPADSTQQKGDQPSSSDKMQGNPFKPRRPWDPSWEKNVTCFACNEKGHIAAYCPKKKEVTYTVSTSNRLMVHGSINGKQTSELMLDSGADRTTIFSKFVNESDYLGESVVLTGANGYSTMRKLAKVLIEVDGKQGYVNAVVTDTPKMMLLGRDWKPFLETLIVEAKRQQTEEYTTLHNEQAVPEQVEQTFLKQDNQEITQGQPNTQEKFDQIFPKEHDQTTTQEEPDHTVQKQAITQELFNQAAPKQQNQTITQEQLDQTATSEQTLQEQQMTTQKQNDVSETPAMIREQNGETIEANPVQTRKMTASEKERCTQDDKESEDSGAGATDLFLHHMDPILDVKARESRPHLSRAQKRVQAKKIWSKVQEEDEADAPPLFKITPTALAEAQREDDSLREVRDKASKHLDNFWWKDNLLFHASTDSQGQSQEQVVVPRCFRKDLLNLAHKSATSAHLGVKKTVAKLYRQFYWPGLSTDVKAACKECSDCQKAGKANRHKAPLIPLPVIEEPFQRLAIDIVGPLKRTNKGHKWILTIMDFATRYPEAIPLRKTDATSVANALCVYFTKMGIPREVLSDRGSNFLSKVMKEMSKMLDIKQIATSPYHPQCDGMLERFHGTLKSMITKIGKGSKHWDEWLPFACFAARDSVHSATGFTPFQLLFGREVRGPLKLLKEQWTGDIQGGRTVVEFVSNLQKKMAISHQLAKESEKEAKKKSKLYYDRTAKERAMKIGEKVLLLLPDDLDKFTAQWVGPYVIEKKLSQVNYEIATPDRRKKKRVVHINMLKPWVEETSVMAVTCADEDIDSMELPIHTLEPETDEGLHINPCLTTSQKQDLLKLLKEIEHNLSNVPGITKAGLHHIKTGDSPPIAQQPYRIPHAWKEKVKQEIQGMLDAGIIVPSSSPWMSPIVPVKKHDGNIRVCVDYRKLNSVSEDDKYQMPRVDDLVEQIGNARFITKLDLTKGYYQVPVAECDQKKTAFGSPQGKFEFKRMPFGLKGAPTTFQRTMDELLSPHSEYASAYIDDIVIFSDEWEQHLDHIRKIFETLEKAGLKAKPAKCYFAMHECSFLGHTVGRGSIRPEQAKIEAVANFRRSKKKRDVQAFLGLIGYYRKFIKNFSAMAARLTDLTRKDCPNKIAWNQELEEDFVALRDALLQKPVLKCPDYKLKFTLQSDASDRGIGAVLSQTNEIGTEHPIAYYSRKLLPREQRYATIEKECLGIVCALKHFEVYLLGHEFTIATDHQALKFLQRMKNSNSRLTRWALAIQPFQFNIVHKPGLDNTNADGLSRQAWAEEIHLKDDNAQPEEGEGSVG